jgi:small-conductance mechanosensitive channel
MSWSEVLEASTWLLNYRLFDIAGTPITVGTLVVFVGIVLFSWILSRVMQRAAGRTLKRRFRTDDGTQGAVQRLLHYLIMVVGTAIALQTVGIDVSALFAAGAVFAIGLGFAMQNIAQNFVSGIILLVERSIKPGDILQVDNRFVKVSKMGIRATIARTLDDEEIIVPNSTIVQSVVTNYTLRDSVYRLRTSVGVTYGSDMSLVRKTLQGVSESMEWRYRAKEPVVLLVDFGNSAVIYEVSVWVEDPWSIRRAKSELNESIWWAFQEQGITIAFPQLDVHFDGPVVESLAALKPAV